MSSATTSKPATAPTPTDNGQGAGSVANLLKMIQASSADLPAPERQKRLREVIDRETKKLSAEDRATFLDRLADYFPAWGKVIPGAAMQGIDPADVKALAKALAERFAKLPEADRGAIQQDLRKAQVIPPPPPAPAAAAPAPAASQGIDPSDAKSLVKALSERFAKLSAGDQDAVQQDLRKAHVIPPTPEPAPAPSGGGGGGGGGMARDRVQKLLGEYFSPKQPANPDLSRVLEMFVVMADQYMKLEEAVASQFPKRQGAEDQHLPVSQENLQLYLTLSEGDGKRAKLKAEIEKQLTGLNYRVWSMMKAVESLPRRYARTRSPSAIEDAPELAGGKGFFGGDKKFQKCWEKYVELCGGRDSGNLVKTMTDLYAQILGEILQAQIGSPGRSAADSPSGG
jgi:hypothetical protein